MSKWIADRLSDKICYWVLIRCGSTRGIIERDEEVPAVPFTVVLNRWSKRLDVKPR